MAERTRGPHGRFVSRLEQAQINDEARTSHSPSGRRRTQRTEFLALARKRFDQANTADSDQRARELADLRFYAGEQWDADIQKQRQGKAGGAGLDGIPARPCLVINNTREPVRQVLNQERASDMGIELIPADDFGEMAGPIDHTEIKLREGLVRRIQRDSEAADARTWAFARSVIAGRGYYGVMTRYVPGKSFDQEIYLQRFYNQASVSLDPSHEQPDGSDAEWGFVGTNMPWEQYKAEHGKRGDTVNDVVSCSNDEFRALGDEAPGWFTTDGDVRSCRVVDYYYTERTVETLWQLEDGRGLYTHELLPDTPLARDEHGKTISRQEIRKTIKWAKLDGCDDGVLDETDWPGKYIPIIKVLGEELQPYDTERRCEGMVRPALDSCRSFNYMVSKWVEQIGLAPIPPWMMAAGQDEGFEAEYAASTTRTLPALHYNQKDLMGQPAPPPFRTNVQTDVQAIAASVQMFREAITNTMGVPEASLGHVDPTLKSGKAIRAVLQQAERGTSNFLDNLVRSMRHEARIVNDLLYPIYGRKGRLVRLMNPQGETESALLHQPFVMTGEGPQARPTPAQEGQQGTTTYTLTKDADWNVAIKVSKNYDTRREQEAVTLGEIISADPAQMAVIGDLFFKYQDGPGHEEMSERYKVMLAPQVQALVSGQAQLPPGVQAQMQQFQMENEQLKQMVATDQAKNQATLQKAQLDAESDLQKTQMASQATLQKSQMDGRLKLQQDALKIEADLEIARLDNLTRWEIAKLQVAAKAQGMMAEQENSAMSQALDHVHDQAMGREGHQQSLESAREGQAHEAAIAETDRQLDGGA